MEVWLAGAGTYREISSRSTCGRPPSCCTPLNGSSLAVGRTMAALLEAGQQVGGSLLLPKALTPYMGTNNLVVGRSKNILD